MQLDRIDLLTADRQTTVREATYDFAGVEREASLEVAWQLSGTFVEGFAPDAYDTQLVLKETYADGSVEYWRITRIQRIRENGQPARLGAQPLWMDLDHRTARVATGDQVDLTVTITGISAQAALNRILAADLGCDRDLFRPGTVDAGVNADQVFIAATNTSHFELLRTLSNRVEGEIAFEWDAANGWYDVHIKEHVGALTPGERVISETGARLNRKRLQQDQDGREAFSRIVATGGSEEAPAQIGRAWWGNVGESSNGDGTWTYTLRGDPVFDAALFTGFTVVDWEGTTASVTAATAPNEITVDAQLRNFGLISFRDGSGNQLTGFTHAAAEAEIGRIERRVSFSGVAAAANLLEHGEVSPDLSDWSCQGGTEAACGWFETGTGSEVATSQTTAALDVQHGTSSLNVQPNDGHGVSTRTVPIAPTGEAGPYVSAWINMRVLSGSVRVELNDAVGGSFPEGEELVIDSSILQAYALGGFEPEAGALDPAPKVNITIRALEPGTEFVVDAATITQTAEPVPYSADMGPNAVFKLAGEALADAGRPADALSGLVYDLGALGLAADELALGDAVTVELEGQSAFVARVVEVKTRQTPGSEEIEKEVTLDRTTPEATPRITEGRGQAVVRSTAVTGGQATVFTGVPESRTLTMGSGLLIGGASSANLSQDRTITLNVGPQFTFSSGTLHIAEDAISDTHIAYPLVSVDIQGGAIEDTPIGQVTPSDAGFSSLSVVSTAADGSFAVTVQNTTSSGELLRLVNFNGNDVLQVRQDGSGEPYLYFDANDGTRWVSLRPTAPNFLNPATNVGIKTDSPQQPVHLGAATRVDGTVTPGTAYTYNLGSPQLKWLTLHAAELRVATLVAADELVTMGGRQIVGTATELIAGVTAGATTIDVRHNNLANGTWIRLEAGGQFEEMQVTSAATSITGGYRYSVTRNADGSGANAWEAGDAVTSLGATSGYGFIDQYAVQSFHTGKTTSGPATAYMVRTGPNRTDVDVRALAGNLNGWYGFSSDTFGFAAGDPAKQNLVATASEVALRHGTTAVVRLDSSGKAFVERRIELSGNGVFTNSNDDFKLNADGLTIGSTNGFTGGRAIVFDTDQISSGYAFRIWSGPTADSVTTMRSANTMEIATATFEAGSQSDLVLSSAGDTFIRQQHGDDTRILRILKQHLIDGHESEFILLNSREAQMETFDGNTFDICRVTAAASGPVVSLQVNAKVLLLDNDGVQSPNLGVGAAPVTSTPLRVDGLPTSNPGTSGGFWYDTGTNNVKYNP